MSYMTCCDSFEIAGAKLFSCSDVVQYASFAGKKVSHIETKADATLTVYLDNGHAFVALQNPKRQVKIVRGLYPWSEELFSNNPHFYEDESQTNELNVDEILARVRERTELCMQEGIEDCFPEDQDQSTFASYHEDPLSSGYGERRKLEVQAVGSATTKLLFPIGTVSSKWTTITSVEKTWYVDGDKPNYLNGVQNELVSYGIEEKENSSTTDFSSLSDIPHIDFKLTNSRSFDVEKFITEYERACQQANSDRCSYSLLGYNCVDFAQEVFSKTGYPGHFIEYFQQIQSANASVYNGLAPAYAQFTGNPEFRTSVKNSMSLGGTIMLGALFGHQIKAAANNVYGWFTKKEEGKQPTDLAELKELLQTVGQLTVKIEEPSSSLDGSPEAKRIIDEVVDIQSRFDEIEVLLDSGKKRSQCTSRLKAELKSMRNQLEQLLFQCDRYSFSEETEAPE